MSNFNALLSTIMPRIGSAISSGKSEGPSTRISFVFWGFFWGGGIAIWSQMIFIPKDKIREILSKIHNVLECIKVKLKQLQYLVEVLAIVVKALPEGRAFSHWLYGAMEGVNHIILLE